MRTQEQITQEFREALTRAGALWGELLACHYGLQKATPAAETVVENQDGSSGCTITTVWG
jgi:hypothetical protein